MVSKSTIINDIHKEEIFLKKNLADNEKSCTFAVSKKDMD